MRAIHWWLLAPLAGCLAAAAASGQDPRQFVQKAVTNELAKDEVDHSHWIFFEVDQKPEHPVRQWVALTSNGNLRRIIQIDGQTLSPAQQQQRMDSYLADSGAQTKGRKSEAHDDREATEMLELLPKAFIWTNEGEKGTDTVLHFKPDPSFRPPDLESKVFAAMEGDMRVDTKQLRIASIKGKLIQDVKIWGGVLGTLDSGGTFDVERRETGSGIWQITETHVHIQGHALIFKNISEQEDDVKSDFRELPASITMQQVKNDLLQEGRDGERASAQNPRGTK
ncbi:MAG TPA: hypothetical protein VKB38_05235 [Terracidiphilus sp.]|nr:hypothetical protein [Terracidiphilus sp.]